MNLFLLNGNKDIIIKNTLLKFSEVIKIDEKDLVSFFKTRRLLVKFKQDELIFGVKDLEFQRFIIFLKFYILITTMKGMIIDEYGIIDKFSLSKFFLSEIPLLFYEIISSALIVLYFYIKMPFLRWIIYKKKK